MGNTGQQRGSNAVAGSPLVSRVSVRTRLRRWSATLMLCLLFLSGGLYYYFTRSDRLIWISESYLGRWINGQVEIEGATFSFFEGIRLEDVTLQPFSVPAQGIKSDSVPHVFHCEVLWIKHDPLAFFLGRLEASEITARNAQLNLISDSRDGSLNVKDLLKKSPGLKALGLEPAESRYYWPRVYISGMQVEFFRVEHGELVRSHTTRVDIGANQRNVSSYRISWRDRTGHQQTGQANLNLLTGSMEFEPGSRPPWLPVEFALAAMPIGDATYQKWTRLLDIEGQFQAENLAIGRSEGSLSASGRLSLQNAQLSIPISIEEEELDSPERFFHFTQVHGWVELTHSKVRARFSGDLRGRNCNVDFSVDQLPPDATRLSEADWTLNLSSDDFLLLRNDRRPYPLEAGIIERLMPLRVLYRCFAPSGRVRFSGTFHKDAGANQSPRLKQARLNILEGEATFHHFRYLLQDITGVIEVNEEGVIQVEDVRARHGRARIRLQGVVEGFNAAAPVDLSIHVQNVELEDDLCSALSERHQELWRDFQLGGVANLDIRLQRQPTGNEAPSLWRTEIDGMLLAGSICYKKFPYHIEELSGPFRIGKGFAIEGLRGRSGGATIRLSGASSLEDDAASGWAVNVSAKNVPIDERLFRALPETHRAALRRFRPEGTVNVTGRVSAESPKAQATYTFDVGFDSLALKHEVLPYSLKYCEGQLRVSPGHIELREFKSHRGAMRIIGEGSYRPEEGAWILDAKVRNLQLNEELWSSFPEALQDTVRKFHAKGLVDVHAVYQMRSQPKVVYTHKMILTAKENELCHEQFPLTLSHVTGELVIEDRTIDLVDITARHKDALLRAGGYISLKSQHPQVRLKLIGQNLHFDDSLHRALPPGLRRIWKQVQPEGPFDIELEELSTGSTQADPGNVADFLHQADSNQFVSSESPTWRMRGDLGLKGARFDFGALLDEVHGLITFDCSAQGNDRDISVQSSFLLETAELSSIRLNDISGELFYDRSLGLLGFKGLSAVCYQGQVDGAVMVRLDPAPATYDLVASFGDADVSRLLKDRIKDGEDAPDVRGVADGWLALKGQFGAPATMRGGGNVHIDQARMYDLPLLLEVLSVINLNPVDQGAFQACRFDYNIQGRVVTIDDLLLQGDALALAGGGQVFLDDMGLDLSLVSVTPRKWLRLPLLTEALEGASRELLGIEIKGTTQKPIVRTYPLRRLSQGLRDLLDARASDSSIEE